MNMSGIRRTARVGYILMFFILNFLCNFVDFSNLVSIECNVFNDAEHITYTREQLVHLGQNKHAEWPRLTGHTCSNIRRLGLVRRPRRRGHRGGVKKRSLLERRHINHNNLTNIKLLKDHWILKGLSKTQMHLGSINIRSVKNKDVILTDYLSDNQVDAVIVTETWLKTTEEDNIWIEQNCLTQHGYKFLSSPRRNTKRDGGLALCIRSEYHCVLIKHEDKIYWQYAVWRIQTTDGPLVIFAVYRPPLTKGININTFLGDFLETYAEIQTKHNNVIVMGDFNIHMNQEEDPDAQSFLADLDVMGLRQYVNFATHQKGHLLDLIIMNSNGVWQAMDPTAGEYLSDHRFVHMVLKVKKEPLRRVTRSVLNLDDIDSYDLIKEADLGELYCMEDIDEILKVFERKVCDAIQTFSEKTQKLVTLRPKVPWITKEVKDQKRIVRNRERVWKKYGEDHQWLAFKREQKRYKSMITHTRNNVLTSKILDCGRDAKKIICTGLQHYGD